MFKMGCSMAKKILAIDGKQAPDQQESSSSSSKLSKQTDKHQEFASAGPAGGGGGSGSGGKRGTGDELGDFSKLEEDPRNPLNVRQIFKITKSWKAIARTMSKTGTAMFLNLFEQNQDLLNLFQRFQHLKGRELHESTELREHAAQVMSILDQSINSLSDYDNFVAYLHSIGKSHRKVPGFKRAHFWKIEQPFLKAVKQTLDERCNETIEGIYKIAIKLIIETIADGYGQDEEDSTTDSLAMRPADGGQGGQGGKGSGNSGGSGTDGKGREKEDREQRKNSEGNSMTQQQKENHKSSSTTKKTPTNRATKKSTSDSELAWLRVEQFVGLDERRILDERNGNKDTNNNNKKKNNNNSNEYEHLTAINGGDHSHTWPPGSCKYELPRFSPISSSIDSSDERKEEAEKLGGKAGEKELKETLFVLRELLTLLVSRRDSTKTHQQPLSTSPLPHLQQPLRRKPLIQKQTHGLPMKRQLEDTETVQAPAEEAGRGSGSLINSTSEFNVKACAPVDCRSVPLVSYRKMECKKMSEATSVASPATTTKIEPQAETLTETAAQTGWGLEVGQGKGNGKAKGIANEGIANVGADFERHNNNCCLTRQPPGHREPHTIDNSSKVCGVRLAQDLVPVENENSSEGDKDAACCLSGNLDKSSRRLRASDDSIYRANCALLFEDTKLEPVKMDEQRERQKSNNIVSCRLESQVVKFPELAAPVVNVKDPLTANKLLPRAAADQRNSKRPFHSQHIKEKGALCRRSESGSLEKAQVACEAFSSTLTSHYYEGDIHSARNSKGGSRSNSCSDNQETHHVERPFQTVDKPSREEFSHRKSLDEEKRSCSSVCSSQIKQSSHSSSRCLTDQFERVSEIGPDERENEAKSNKEEGADNNTGHYFDDRNSMKKREKLQLSADPGDLRELIKMLMLTKQANSRHLAAAVPASENNHTICAPHNITILHQTTITSASS